MIKALISQRVDRLKPMVWDWKKEDEFIDKQSKKINRSRTKQVNAELSLFKENNFIKPKQYGKTQIVKPKSNIFKDKPKVNKIKYGGFALDKNLNKSIFK